MKRLHVCVCVCVCVWSTVNIDRTSSSSSCNCQSFASAGPTIASLAAIVGVRTDRNFGGKFLAGTIIMSPPIG